MSNNTTRSRRAQAAPAPDSPAFDSAAFDSKALSAIAALFGVDLDDSDEPPEDEGGDPPTPTKQMTVETPAPKSGHVRISVSELHPAPENDTLYGAVSAQDPEIQALAKDIRERGVLEPIVTSTDHYIISGHRRFVAAQAAGITTVPYRLEPISYTRDRDRFLVLLRSYNRQRVKSADVLISEAVFDAAEASAARRRLIEHRKARITDSGIDDVAIEIRGVSKRSKIGKSKMAMLEAARAVIAARRKFWPLTDRQIHYGLLNDRPLRHSGKPDSRYANDLASYKDVCDLLLRARLEGLVPWAAIDDLTRPVTTWGAHASVAPFVARECKDFLANYWRDLQISQPCHIEIVGEKNTVANILNPVAGDYTIPITLGRGYASGPPRWKMAQRFLRSGKDVLALIVMSDFDPEGEDIAHSFARSMRDDFEIGGDRIRLVKAGLTHEQVVERRLPPVMKAKAGSSRNKGFVARYGDDVHELEAVPPEDLQGMLRDAIESVMDRDAFAKEQETEGEESLRIEHIRKQVFRSIGPFVSWQGGDAPPGR